MVGLSLLKQPSHSREHTPTFLFIIIIIPTKPAPPTFHCLTLSNHPCSSRGYWKCRSANASIGVVAAASTIGLICHLPTLMPFCFIFFPHQGQWWQHLFHCYFSGAFRAVIVKGLSAFPSHTRTHACVSWGKGHLKSTSRKKNETKQNKKNALGLKRYESLRRKY